MAQPIATLEASLTDTLENVLRGSLPTRGSYTYLKIIARFEHAIYPENS